MEGIAKACTALAALAFLMAVVTSITGAIIVPPEGWSRASTNMALIALCLFIGFKEQGGGA